MKQDNSQFIQKALKHINEIYGFLFEKGYSVFSAEAVSMGWQVILKRQDVFIKILEFRGEEEIFFRMGTQVSDEFTDIGSVIYAATGDKIPRWKSSDPDVLEQYLTKIEAYFMGEYVKNQVGLNVAQKEYFAAFAQGGVVAPPKPKVIPILHYPLMGIIVLLLFGVLTTFYMALLDRLLTAFSLDGSSYGMFMGITSLLLAIGTLLVFWMWRKKG